MKFTQLILLLTGSLWGTDQPNIVFILSDDQDWTETSVQMHPDLPNSKSQYIETPNLEMLARQAMVFSAAYAPAPVCSPTRASLQTGKSPAQLHWTKAASPVTAAQNYPLLPPPILKQLPPEESTIAELLKSAGYATAHFGKWHLSGGGPERHGYDASDGDTSNRDAAPHKAPNPSDVMGISNRANAFMEQCTRDGIPFFIQLAHHALHYPENSSPAMLEKYARLSGRPTTEKSVQRMAMAEHLDQGVGRVMAKIEELGIADQTYLVFMSDNGGSGGGGNQARPGRREPVRPLSGGKGSLWEGGIRVPLIIRGPGVKAGAVCHERVVGYDLFNTFAEWAGIQDTLPSGVEGGSLVPLLATARGEVSRPNDFLVFHFPHYQSDTPHSAIIQGTFKLIYWYENQEYKLFDLSRDIAEANDLSSQVPETAKDLLYRMQTHLTAIQAQIPSENPLYDPSLPAQQENRDRPQKGTRTKRR